MTPIEITITLDLDKWAEGQPYQDYDGEWHSDQPGQLEAWVAHQVAQVIASQLKNEVGNKVLAIVSELATAQAEGLVRKVLSGPIRLTDSYGMPKGEPKTLMELVSEQAGKILSQPRDDRYNYDRKVTLVQQLIRDEVDKAFAGELKPVIDAAKKQAKDAVKNRAAEMLATEMERTR